MTINRRTSPRHLRAGAGVRRVLALAGVASLLGGGIALGTAASASAGTPDVASDCTGVTVNLADFAAKADGQANHVTVTINGKVKVDRDFGASFTTTVAFPNEYRMKGNDWSVSWTAYDDASASGSTSGSEAACERPEQPASYTETEAHPGTPDCEAGTVTNETWTRTVTYVWDYDQWTAVPGEWQVTSETVPVQPGECGPGEQPQPLKKWSKWQDDAWPCNATETTQTRTRTVTPYVLVDGQWVLGTPEVTQQTRTRQLTPDEITKCPVPEKPQPVVVQSDKAAVDCSVHQRSVTTTTTTTDWVLNADETAWVKGTPVVTTSTATFPTTVKECPLVGDVTAEIPPVVKGVKYEAAPAAAALAYTGAETESYGLAGLALLVVGSGLVLVTRRRTVKG
ncbi:MAG TPA: LPXTG cell wall anchor domain-containing protein [Actinomycetales bacterium]|nr:LPXTG cell wall anchor domain-containing protein [Actinomycetales bacterium]